MSSIPASAITSASPSFWQAMPFAPASICSFIKRRAILPIQIGIVKGALQLRNLGLQFGDRFRQGLQRVLFVEIKPPLWRRRRRGRLGLPFVFTCFVLSCERRPCLLTLDV